MNLLSLLPKRVPVFIISATMIARKEPKKHGTMSSKNNLTRSAKFNKAVLTVNVIIIQ